jgi:hypothetical protein
MAARRPVVEGVPLGGAFPGGFVIGDDCDCNRLAEIESRRTGLAFSSFTQVVRHDTRFRAIGSAPALIVERM